MDNGLRYHKLYNLKTYSSRVLVDVLLKIKEVQPVERIFIGEGREMHHATYVLLMLGVLD